MDSSSLANAMISSRHLGAHETSAVMGKERACVSSLPFVTPSEQEFLRRSAKEKEG